MSMLTWAAARSACLIAHPVAQRPTAGARLSASTVKGAASSLTSTAAAIVVLGGSFVGVLRWLNAPEVLLSPCVFVRALALACVCAMRGRPWPLACTAGASSGLPKGLLLVRAWTQAHSSPEQALVVTSQEELDQIREDRFREGIWNASRGALEWGAGAATLIYTARALEPKMFGSCVLQRAGTARLWFLITACSSFGFAVRGEKKLLHALSLCLSRHGQHAERTARAAAAADADEGRRQRGLLADSGGCSQSPRARDSNAGVSHLGLCALAGVDNSELDVWSTPASSER